jgi:hypothetical protein
MKRSARPAGFALMASLVISGCGGGSSGGAPAPMVTVAPTATPPAAPGSKATSVVVKIVVPRGSSSGALRSRHFVSPNSTQFSSTVNTVDGITTLPTGIARTTVVALSTGAGGNCVVSGASETCTIAVPAPAGTDNFTFELLDAANDALSSFTGTFAIVSGMANTLDVELLGIVASLSISDETLTAGTAASDGLTIDAFDASGAAIGGTFASAVMLRDGDSSGASSLATNGGTAGTTASFAASTDSVVLAYDGTAIPSFDITASPLTVTNGVITVDINAIRISGTTTDSNPSDPNFGDPTVFFSSIPEIESVTASETGYAGTFTIDTTACGTGAGAFATFATTDSKTFTITSQVAGLCKVTINDTLSQSAAFYVSVNAATIIIDRHPR